VQVRILIACSRGPSLRRAIGNDRALEGTGLKVLEQQRIGRRHGWAKVYSEPHDKYGAINLHWDPHAALLVGRVVTRSRNKPGPIIGAFIGYLMTKYRTQIQSITIVP
jgi:hypothetical protein